MSSGRILFFKFGSFSHLSENVQEILRRQFPEHELIAPQFPDAELHIVGCSPAAQHQRCRVHGQLPREKVARHLAATDIFCLPSYHEPSSGALVEAALYGLPVVSTYSGGTTDRVHDGVTGILIKSGDVAALADALSRLISDPDLRRRMGDAGRELALRDFTWAAVGDRIGEAIRGVSP